jgi:hypothetical protein
VVKIDEGIGWPELLPQFLTSNDLARPVEQQNQYLEGLVLEPKPNPRLAQLAAGGIDFKHAKPEQSSGFVTHRTSS